MLIKGQNEQAFGSPKMFLIYKCRSQHCSLWKITFKNIKRASILDLRLCQKNKTFKSIKRASFLDLRLCQKNKTFKSIKRASFYRLWDLRRCWHLRTRWPVLCRWRERSSSTSSPEAAERLRDKHLFRSPVFFVKQKQIRLQTKTGHHCSFFFLIVLFNAMSTMISYPLVKYSKFN